MADGNSCTLTYDGTVLSGRPDQPLVEFLDAHGVHLPHVCYHPSLGALQTCDVCWVELDGELVRGNTLFVPIHQGKPGINEMTGEHHDPDVNTPAYKELAVKLECLPQPNGGAPLPSNNYRNHTRTPNAGIDATVKWARDDYIEPPLRSPHPERS